MAAQYILAKSFAAFRGLDLRSGDLLRTKEFASDMRNCEFRSTAALSKRKGYHIKENSAGQGALAVYNNLNTSNGVITDNLVSADESLYVLEEGSITLTYSGSGTAYYTCKATGSSIEFNLYEDDVLVTSQNLGTGLESVPVTQSSFVATLDALSDFTASSTGVDTGPAAFLPFSERTDIGSSVTITTSYNTEVNSPSGSPFAAHWAKRNDPEFEIMSYVNLNGLLYISNGYDELHKYDGQNVYRAGMPEGGDVSASLTGSGTITNSSLKYRLVYYQVDNKGNIVEGIMGGSSTGISAVAQTVDVTVDNIEASSGFNTNAAIIDGTQSGVTTIAVDDGSAGDHTLKVGDTAYFYDDSTSAYVTREVTARTASSITIAGAAVDVTDNTVISNNLRIDIYRNQSSGSTFYLVESIPNNSFASTQVFSDNVPDASLGAEYIEPIKQRGLPPKGRYITLYRNQLIISGFTDDVDAVAYSDVDSPEYFPAGQNRFNVDTEKGDKVTGVKTLNSVLYVFKGQTIHTLTGDLINDDFRVDILTTGGVGCVANATIQEVNGNLFFLDKDGVYSVSQGADGVQEISELISPEFSSNEYNFSRAVAQYWLEQDKYCLYMPELETNGGNITATSNSLVYVYDFFRQGWLIWSNINALGGLVTFNEVLWTVGINYNTNTSNVDRLLQEFQNTGTSVDYSDHEQAISSYYKTHWETLGEPSVFKKFLRLKLFSLDVDVTDFETQLFKIQMTTEQNFNDVPIYMHEFDFANGATGGWGENPWGAFPWGDARLSFIKTKLKSNKAQSLRLTFENNNVNKNYLLSGYELEIAAPYSAVIKE